MAEHRGGVVGEDVVALRAAFEGCTLGPALGWDGVSAFEDAHRVELPEPFRTFVAEVGNGCTEGPPHYGWVRAGEASDVEFDPADGGRLARPFLLTGEWVWEAEEDAPAPGLLPEDPGPYGLYPTPALYDGLLDLGTDGCAISWFLVVTGQQRGVIWLIDEHAAQPFGRSFGYTTAEEGFVGWVRHWSEGNDWFDVVD